MGGGGKKAALFLSSGAGSEGGTGSLVAYKLIEMKVREVGKGDAGGR